MKLINFIIPFLFIMSAHATTNYQTPNMGLTVGVVGQEPGPNWADDINASMTLIDAHDHTPGNGVQITPNGMNINGNLTFNGFSLTSLATLLFSVQSADPSSNYAAYTKGVDLYYKDGNGNVIQITASGGVAGSPGSISGLTSPASASFVSGGGTFVWQQATSTAANMDAATLIIRYPGSYPSPAGNYIALQAPSSLATGYAITLQNATPASSGAFWVESTAGAMSYVNTDNSTVEISSNTLRVKDQGITAAKIANGTITNTQMAAGAAVANIGTGGIGTTQLAAGAVTQAKLAALPYTLGGSTGGFTTSSTSPDGVTNGTVVITSTGRPMWIGMVSDGSVSACSFGNTNGQSSVFTIKDGSTAIAVYQMTSSAGQTDVPGSSLNFVQVAPVAGTRTYTIYINTNNASGSAYLAACKLLAYEL